MRMVWAVVWLCMMGTAALPARGGIEVTRGAARSGEFGLRAVVAPGCVGELNLLVMGPIVTQQAIEACREIVALESRVEGTGDLTLEAGERVVLGEGFSVAPGGRLEVRTGGRWEPTYAIQEEIAGRTDLFVRWYIRFDGAAVPEGTRVVTMRIQGPDGPRGWVEYQAADDGGGWLSATAVTDGGEEREIEGVRIGTGWHLVELSWSTGTIGYPSGAISLWIDQGKVGEVDGLALGTAIVRAVELGVVQADAEGGWVDLDDIAIAADGPIGAE